MLKKVFSEGCSFKPRQNLTKSKDLFERQPCSVYPWPCKTKFPSVDFPESHFHLCSIEHTGSTTQPGFECIGTHSTRNKLAVKKFSCSPISFPRRYLVVPMPHISGYQWLWATTRNEELSWRNGFDLFEESLTSILAYISSTSIAFNYNLTELSREQVRRNWLGSSPWEGSSDSSTRNAL